MIDKDARDACSIRDELRGFIEKALADEGSGMDTGGGIGGADLPTAPPKPPSLS